MQALQPSFMLLPDTTFSPGKNIQLGRVLMQTRDSRKLPDPRRPFVSARLEVSPESLERPQVFATWHWNSNTALNTNAAVWADISLITGIDAGLDGKWSKGDALEIDCEGLVQQTFYPSLEDINKIVKEQTVSRMLKGLERPSVYLITGIMTADKATFKIVHSQARGGGLHTSADLTSIGAPLNTGIKGGAEKSSSSTLVAVPQQPFILAYQLLRLRRKITGGVKDSLATEMALFNDTIPVPGAEELTDFEIEQLLPAE